MLDKMDTGIIKVIKLGIDGLRSARIDCSNSLIPKPGSYTLAYDMDNSVLGWPLFPMGLTSPFRDEDPFFGPLPDTWSPNTQLELRGPLGHGFNLPKNARKLVLVALGDTLARLLPIIHPALESDADIVICAVTPLPDLPPVVEIQHIDNLPDLLTWADFMALDIPLEKLSTLRDILQLDPDMGVPCVTQALIWTPMPCVGVADCGACAVPTRKRGYKLACKDGPVFDLNELYW